jgi:hypothetical protein
MRSKVLVSFFFFVIFFLPLASCTISIIPTIPTDGEGWVELKSAVTYDGNATAKVIYEYTVNNEMFYFIGESDQSPNYNVFWNTTLVSNGQYLIKATVTDTKVSNYSYRIIDINNSVSDSSSVIPSGDSGWSKGFATLNYKETLELIYTGRKVTPTVNYGSMPQIAKDYIAMDMSFSSVSGGQNRIVITSLEIPTDRIESENFKGGVYNIELSVGSDVMSISYNLSSVQPSGTGGFSNTFDQRLSVMESKVTALEKKIGTTATGTVPTDYVSESQLNNAVRSLEAEIQQNGNNNIFANDLNKTKTDVNTLIGRFSALDVRLTNLESSKKDLISQLPLGLSVVAVILSTIGFVTNKGSGIEKRKKPIMQKKSIPPKYTQEKFMEHMRG